MIKYSAGSDLIWDYESQSVKSSSFSSIMVREKQMKEVETKLTNLQNFLSDWRLAYIDFCKIFDCFAIEEPFALKVKYEETLQNKVDELYQYPIHKDFYLNNFFDPILQNRCEYKCIVNEHSNTSSQLRIETRKFNIEYTHIAGWNIIGKDKDYGKTYSIPFLCSLLSVLTNNSYLIYRWYKSPIFLNFMNQLVNNRWIVWVDIENKYFTLGHFRFSFSPFQSRSDLEVIRMDYLDEVLYVDARHGHYYPHLAKIFGSDRKSKLTKEDLELYHMIHNRHPVLYDFEYS